MTTVENHPPPAATDDDLYHSDDVGLRDTPPLKPMKVKFEPSPSPPPAVPLPEESPESSPGPPNHKNSKRSKKQPSQSDAYLVSLMGGGMRLDIARQAGQSPLASDDEEQEESSVKETTVDLAAIAFAASALANKDERPQDVPESAQTTSPIYNDAPSTDAKPGGADVMEDVKPTIPSINATPVGEPQRRPSLEPLTQSEIDPTPSGELPPIRRHSPKTALTNGKGNGSITLPSISAQLGDLNQLGGEAAPAGDSTFSQSPPARSLPPFPAIGHGSSPKSPSDVFRRELPSPGRGPNPFYYNANANTHRRPSQADTPYASAGDYSSSNTETPSTDQSGSTPANMIDRMSIDGITNPQIGGFQCTHPGCTAQPFQTQVSITLPIARVLRS